jgi:hypothetical protein
MRIISHVSSSSRKLTNSIEFRKPKQQETTNQVNSGSGVEKFQLRIGFLKWPAGPVYSVPPGRLQQASAGLEGQIIITRQHTLERPTRQAASS